jgi:hypothetical protein
VIPVFDLVVLDECESLLRHFASPTVRSPIQTTDRFVKMLSLSRLGTVTMDAAWGPLTWSVLRKAELSNLLVVNDRAPSAPRVFAFSNDEASWRDQILSDVSAGLNVVVVSLSSEMAMSVHEACVKACGPELCLLHTSKTGEEVKRQLRDVDALWSRHRVVVYSPTIAAGVDFTAPTAASLKPEAASDGADAFDAFDPSSDVFDAFDASKASAAPHFQRMYLYVCAMSALPSTALQMAFWVRRFADLRVRGLIAPNVRPSLAASRPPLTSSDVAVWMRWMSEARRDMPDVLERVAAPPERQRTLDQLWASFGLRTRHPMHPVHPIPSDVEMASVPLTTYWSLISSFVEAERYNAAGGFLCEFAALAESAGHCVEVSRIATPAPVIADPPSTAAKLLSAAPVVSDWELDVLRNRAACNTASEDDKWRLFAASYLAGWGVDRVDAAFVAANGTEAGSPSARLLCRVLCPSLRRPRGADVGLADQTGVFKVLLVAEVVTALGLRSPFDDELVIPDLMAVFAERVSKTWMFRDYANTSRAFRQASSGVTGDWDLFKVVKAVNMVLGAAGLKLSATKETRAGRGAARKSTSSHYRLDPESVATMVELVKLRLRRAVLSDPDVLSCAHESARERLDACSFPRYGHLVDDSPPAYAFVDDE